MVNRQQHMEVFSALCWSAMMWLLWVWLWLSHVQPCCFNTRSPTEGLPLSCWDCWRMVTSLLFSGVVSFTSSLYRLPAAMCLHYTKTNWRLIETPLGKTASEVSVTAWQHLSDRLRGDIPRSMTLSVLNRLSWSQPWFNVGSSMKVRFDKRITWSGGKQQTIKMLVSWLIVKLFGIGARSPQKGLFDSAGRDFFIFFYDDSFSVFFPRKTAKWGAGYEVFEDKVNGKV